MEDGATPLIIAARLAIEGMVEDLVNADADINAADEKGILIILHSRILISIVLVVQPKS